MYTSLHPVTYYFYPLFDTATPNSQTSVFDQSMTQAPAAGVESLLYVHIPYCHDMCKFCPFHVRVDKGEQIYQRYVDAACLEMERVGRTARAQNTVFRAVYFGGGSPSILPPSMLRQLFVAIGRHFRVAADAEISFEGEPKTLGDAERLDVLKEFDVSRISFGLQTYDQQLRKHFNINATLDDVERATRLSRERKFDEINVDMMYNLPGQTVRQLEQDIAHLIDADFDSIDYYNLHYYAFPKKFNEMMATGEIPAKPSDGVMLALAEQLRHLLPRAGYRNVADQVYSKKGKVCEYFRLLWGGGNGRHDAETIAIGSSARGYVDGVCYMNHGNVNRYMDAIEAGESPVEKVSARLACPEDRGAVFFSKFLRLEKRYERAVDAIPADVFKSWLDDGYVYDDGDAWALSERGKLWTNNMTQDAFETAQLTTAKASLITLMAKPGIRTGTF
jgi:anaerobilin synthase